MIIAAQILTWKSAVSAGFRRFSGIKGLTADERGLTQMKIELAQGHGGTEREYGICSLYLRASAVSSRLVSSGRAKVESNQNQTKSK
jgi:hypothetical protein